jgi:F-type H+-transporting ATPase subunit delta
MRKISAKKYAISLYESLEEAPEKEVHELIKDFIKLLIRKNQINLIGKILLEFEKHWNEKEGIKKVEVTTSQPLLHKKIITDELKKYLQKTIELEEKVDKEIIGGLIIKYDDILIDGSVKKRLAILRQKLSTN